MAMTTTTTSMTVFDTLTSLFPTSEALYAYLSSTAGGGLMVVQREGESLAMIYYDKVASNLDLIHVPYFRSVVWNSITNKPVSVGPARGKRFGAAVDAHLEPGSFTTEEYVDGIMIHQFHDGTRWRLATRTQLDATVSFFGKRPFAELFQETFAAQGLSADQLDPAESYIWVLQHPEERIVVAPAYGIAKLFLLNKVVPEALAALRPASHRLNTLEDVKVFVESSERRLGHQFMGVNVYDQSGNRYKLRSSPYEVARMLRGNQAKKAFTWLALWPMGKLPAYLRIYPEEQCDADAVIAKFKEITQEAHTMYLRVYRQRELPLGKAPQKFRKLLWDAHKEGKGAYFPNMRAFMNQLDTARKLWLVNYEQRYGTTTVAEETQENQQNQEVQEPVVPIVEEVKADV
jgi:hypothetical protein